MTAMTAPDYTTQWSQQPDIMAIRNSSSWRAAHTNITTPANNADSVYYDVMNFTAGTWTRKGVNNTTSSLPGSGVLGPKPSYRYVSGDSCLTIWAPSGPIGLWSAIGCTGTIFTGITTTNNGVPNSFSLSQNYPNPFNPVTNIKFSIPNAGLVKLVVFDVAGREVATLINENVAAGYYNADFDASSLSSGVYFYQITSGDFVDTKKMVLIK
ncbi:MAG: T9SS type A sorting domain-containing protein [Ignavibacteria bacterium]|nr:T9SS type A sorting domain-containing protein [Ignavibacteria bacterium]MCC7158159.1 T9SS type A sorting domain-containing protein [Ignavibacteria bacterium]